MNQVRMTMTEAQNGAVYWLLVLAAMTMMVLAIPQAQADNLDHQPSLTKARVQLAAQKAAMHFAGLSGQPQTKAKLVRVNAVGNSTPKR